MRKILCVLALLMLSGCAMLGGNRVVFVRQGDPVRLAETVKARVWVKDKDGKEILSDNQVELQEGSYNLVDPGAPKTPASK